METQRIETQHIETQRIEIPVSADGTVMGAYLARPDARPDAPAGLPAVIVGMELFGVDAYVREVCDRLARLGFTALAPDFHHRTAPGAELPRDDTGRARGFELLQLMTGDQALADVGAAVARLRADGHEQVSMLGLSMGGHLAYLAATAHDLEAVAVFYAGWLPTTDIPLSRPEPTLDRTAAITARVLFLVGEEDHLIPPHHQQLIREALRAAGVRHEFVAYPGVGHRFLATDPEVAADAWDRACTFLAAGERGWEGDRTSSGTASRSGQ